MCDNHITGTGVYNLGSSRLTKTRTKSSLRSVRLVQSTFFIQPPNQPWNRTRPTKTTNQITNQPLPPSTPQLIKAESRRQDAQDKAIDRIEASSQRRDLKRVVAIAMDQSSSNHPQSSRGAEPPTYDTRHGGHYGKSITSVASVTSVASNFICLMAIYRISFFPICHFVTQNIEYCPFVSCNVPR